MVRFGIPEYRLPRTLIRSEIEKILALGVQLESNTPLSFDFGLSHLRQAGFEAVFLAVGVAKGRDLQVPGVELDGVVKAVDYLLNVNRGYRMDLGRRIVVIGGGFVAFDAARTAIREGDDGASAAAQARVKEALDSARAAIRGGAREVTIVSLENFDEMPVLRTTQGHEEFEEARKEGVRFVTRRGAARFAGSSRLSAIDLRRVTEVFDANGRFAPQYDDADVITIEADSCILAIGQQPDLSFLTAADGVAKRHPEPFASIATRWPRRLQACSQVGTWRLGRAISSRLWPMASGPRADPRVSDGSPARRHRGDGRHRAAADVHVPHDRRASKSSSA